MSTLLRWPPPGLERLQGDLWRVAEQSALAGGLLVLPIVLIVAPPQEFSSLGPLADAWWVALILATAGLAFAIDAVSRTVRLLRRSAQALEGGYDPGTVGYVLADLSRDMGFLLQARRHFGVMEERERRGVAFFRVVAALCAAGAGLWMPLGMALGLLLGAYGVVGSTGVWVLPLVPAAAAYAVAAVLLGITVQRVRRARRAWFRQPWASDLVASEIHGWRETLGQGPGAAFIADPAPRLPRLLRRGGAVLAVAAVVAAVPVLTLMPMSTLGPLLATVSLPRLDRVQQRAARTEALRGRRVEPDTSLSPQEASRLYQRLLHVGSGDGPSRGEQPPDLVVEEPWIPSTGDGPNPTGSEPHRWAETLFRLTKEGLPPEADAYLRRIAAHPSQEDFGRLARAARLDVGAARWTDPLPEDLGLFAVPYPPFSVLRQASYARLAAAAVDLADGRAQAAEEKVREIISVGLLVGDESPVLLESVVGHVVAEMGGVALQRLYEATGRVDDARGVADDLGMVTRASARVHTPPAEGLESFVRTLPPMVLDTGAVRGLRWEMFALTTTVAPCLNMQRMVLGPDSSYRSFLQRAHDALVRWPSEEELFRRARWGYWGPPSRQAHVIGRLLAVSMEHSEGSCGGLVRTLGTDDLGTLY